MLSKKGVEMGGVTFLIRSAISPQSGTLSDLGAPLSSNENVIGNSL